MPFFPGMYWDCYLISWVWGSLATWLALVYLVARAPSGLDSGYYLHSVAAVLVVACSGCLLNVAHVFDGWKAGCWLEMIVIIGFYSFVCPLVLGGVVAMGYSSHADYDY